MLVGFAEGQSRISIFLSYVRFDFISELREIRQSPTEAEAALAHRQPTGMPQNQVIDAGYI
jgi:hypothetical protein